MFELPFGVIGMFKLCTVCHGMFKLPFGVIGWLNCMLGVMVCLIFFFVLFVR